MCRLQLRRLLFAMILPIICGAGNANSQPAVARDDYTARIQPIFDKRCVACHSCYNAPLPGRPHQTLLKNRKAGRSAYLEQASSIIFQIE